MRYFGLLILLVAGCDQLRVSDCTCAVTTDAGPQDDIAYSVCDYQNFRNEEVGLDALETDCLAQVDDPSAACDCSCDAPGDPCDTAGIR